MRSIFVTISFFIIFLSCTKDSIYILENVKVVDLVDGEIVTCNLLIRENTITQISKEPIHGYRKIDLQGKYVMPSLWDMHVHIHADKAKLNKFFNQGILGVRDLGAFNTSQIDSLIKWKQELNQKKALKQPYIEYAGLINNDTLCYHGHRNIATFNDLKESVGYLKDIGSSYYKVHNCFPFELLPQLDSLAENANFEFGGHIPEGIDPLSYVRQFDKINSIEHVSVLVRALSFRKENPLSMIEAVNLLDGPYLDSLALTMKEKNIAFTPNLLSEVEFIKTYPKEQQHLGESLMKRFRNYVKRFSDHGVTLLAGTDIGLDSSDELYLFHEFELLAEAGLSNLEILQSATINAHRALRGSINLLAENSIANFIILKKNPLDDLSALNSIYAIVHLGYFTELN